MTAPFLHPREHFESLALNLPTDDLSTFGNLAAVRVITAYKGRSLVLYTLVNGKPQVKDRLNFRDFVCNEEVGATTEVSSAKYSETSVVGYAPERLFGWDLFAWIPLHARIHWDVIPDPCVVPAPDKSPYSLGFNCCLKMHDARYFDREGVLYALTGREFSSRFPGTSTDF
jgi:hypothetical protein